MSGCVLKTNAGEVAISILIQWRKLWRTLANYNNIDLQGEVIPDFCSPGSCPGVVVD
jgi:hypothetical protein